MSCQDMNLGSFCLCAFYVAGLQALNKKGLFFVCSYPYPNTFPCQSHEGQLETAFFLLLLHSSVLSKPF